MKANILLDADGTLMLTDKTRPYRSTREGRDWVAKNPEKVETTDVPGLCDLVKELNKNHRVYVATNADEAVTRALMRKHGYPDDIQIFSSLNKPNDSDLDIMLRIEGLNPADTIMIGDSPRDVLAAHGCNMASIGVSWGHFDAEKIQKAEPSLLVSTVDDLENAIVQFEMGLLIHEKRKVPATFNILPISEYNGWFPWINYAAYQKYYGANKGGFEWSVIAFKRAKEFSGKVLHAGIPDYFFHNRQPKWRQRYNDVVIRFINRITALVQSLDLKGTTYIMAAPNSEPEYCYKTDINRVMIKNVAKRLGLTYFDSRAVCRIHPKPKLNRDRIVQFTTMGIKQLNAEKPDNVVIFDDVLTTGTQAFTMAKLISHFGFADSKFYVIGLGETPEFHDRYTEFMHEEYAKRHFFG
ncbi:HAD hydrolase-like protein [Candidatus Woesearchaeota archaeon]|nr:HAD hydrolase-like protein [Candidatus Woesearchaeota archaeon]MBW3022311.1 HAD hydrolase-like protein [Candidatus Woesearchaeota archaeon]